MCTNLQFSETCLMWSPCNQVPSPNIAAKPPFYCNHCWSIIDSEFSCCNDIVTHTHTGAVPSSKKSEGGLLEDLQHSLHWLSSELCLYSIVVHHDDPILLSPQDALVPAYPRIDDDAKNSYLRNELNIFL